MTISERVKIIEAIVAVFVFTAIGFIVPLALR